MRDVDRAAAGVAAQGAVVDGPGERAEEVVGTAVGRVAVGGKAIFHRLQRGLICREARRSAQRKNAGGGIEPGGQAPRVAHGQRIAGEEPGGDRYLSARQGGTGNIGNRRAGIQR